MVPTEATAVTRMRPHLAPILLITPLQLVGMAEPVAMAEQVQKQAGMAVTEATEEMQRP
jgi:hypothetical protein